jgi:pyrimidine-nucleoside phosphorylase
MIQPFDPVKFIRTKQLGHANSRKDIGDFIDAMVHGRVMDYQVTAWLMAVWFNGLNMDETTALTQAMAGSGKIMKWDDPESVVDKHSTGGVGDSVTLILAPLVASMGLKMGKHSGRGLGHTGGTIDKLESISGFRTSLSEDDFKKIVTDVGCAVAGQDSDMTPADGILYSLRDVTSTVDNESLIAASIMSKKLAGGAPSILLDVKVGTGAFMKDIPSAQSLADRMVAIGRESLINVNAVLTWMNTPLSSSIGNALEVREAIEILKNESDMNNPLRHVCIEFASRLYTMARDASVRAGRELAREKLESGAAYEKFEKMVNAQGGDLSIALPAAKEVMEIKAWESGYITKCDALCIGELVRDLGGGRKKKTDEIDLAAGIILNKRIGNMVDKGDVLCEVHHNGTMETEDIKAAAMAAWEFSDEEPKSIGLFIY